MGRPRRGARLKQEIQPFVTAFQNEARTNQSLKTAKLIQIKTLMVPEVSCGISRYKRSLKPVA